MYNCIRTCSGGATVNDSRKVRGCAVSSQCRPFRRATSHLSFQNNEISKHTSNRNHHCFLHCCCCCCCCWPFPRTPSWPRRSSANFLANFSGSRPSRSPIPPRWSRRPVSSASRCDARLFDPRPPRIRSQPACNRWIRFECWCWWSLPAASEPASPPPIGCASSSAPSFCSVGLCNYFHQRRAWPQRRPRGSNPGCCRCSSSDLHIQILSCF